MKPTSTPQHANSGDDISLPIAGLLLMAVITCLVILVFFGHDVVEAWKTIADARRSL